MPTYDFFSVHRESLLPFFTAFLTIRYLIIKLRVVCSTVLFACSTCFTVNVLEKDSTCVLNDSVG